MNEPSSDAKLQLGELLATVKAFTGQMGELRAEVTQCRMEMRQMEKRLDERTAPKPVPWLSIAGFTITFLGFIAVILGAFILYHINPLKKDIEEVNRKIERDTQAMERRLTAEIESSRRDITAFKEEIRRENTWNYAYNNLRHDHNTRLIEKLWPRVFASDPPAFQQPAKPSN